MKKIHLVPEKTNWFKLLFLFVLNLPNLLLAQNNYIVANGSGTVIPGSLGAAITALNGSLEAGSVTFETVGVELEENLAPVSQSVTFQGTTLTIIGQNETESQFVFQQAFTQQVQNLTLENNGSGTGLDLAVTSASWNIAPDDNLYLYSAVAPLTQGSPDSGVTGLTGGNIEVNTGNWNMGGLAQFAAGSGGAVTSSNGIGNQGGTAGTVSLTFNNLTFTGTQNLQISAGAGGAVTDTNGSGDQGGTGGAVIILGDNYSFSANGNQLQGGNGGSVTDLGTGTPQGGTGGSVFLSMTDSLSVSLGNLTLQAGIGGSGVTGGSGGGATLSAGSVTLLSGTLSVEAGIGGSGTSISGSYGAAYVSIGSLQGQGTLYLDGSSSLLQIASGSFAGNLAGNDSLQKMGSGLLTLSGENDYSGGTTISAGILAISKDGNLGASGTTLTLDGGTLQTDGNLISSRVVNLTGSNGAINLNGFSSSLSGQISGTGSLLINGQGYLSLLGTNSYSGGTTVMGGILGISNDDNLGSAGTTLTLEGGTLQANAALTSSRDIILTGNIDYINLNSFSSSLSGLISGTGSLYVEGQGNLILSGNNTYNGGTTLVGGALEIGSSLALGTGGVEVTSGILESAGSPITLHVGGNYNQGSNGALRMGLGGTGATVYDLLESAGTIDLNGSLYLYSYGGLTSPTLGTTKLLIYSSDSLSGTFQQIYENLGDVRLLPLYDTNGVELEAIDPSFLSLSSTPNQKVIGADLDAIVFKPTLSRLMSQLGVMSAQSLQSSENEISPSGLSSLFQAGFEGALSRSQLVSERLFQWKDSLSSESNGFSESASPLFAGNLPAGQEGSMMSHPPVGQWSGFISGEGGFFNTSGTPNAAGYQISTYGINGAGADYQLSQEAALGLMVGFDQSNINLDGNGTLNASDGQIGLYGLFSIGNFFADALIEGGLDQYTTQRQSFGGLANGQTQGQEWSGFAQLGYAWKEDKVSIGPIASLQITRVGLNSFSEQGSQSPLSFPSQSQESLMSQLGLRADFHWRLGSTTLVPELTLAWEHEYDNLGGSIAADLVSGDIFTVDGPALGQDGIFTNLGLNLYLSKNLSAGLHYQGELNRTNLDSQQFTGDIQLNI